MVILTLSDDEAKLLAQRLIATSNYRYKQVEALRERDIDISRFEHEEKAAQKITDFIFDHFHNHRTKTPVHTS